MMSSLQNLPTELIEHVVSYLDQRDILNTAYVAKRLYAISFPLLYRNVDLRIRYSSGNAKEKFFVPRIDKFFFWILENAQYTKSVKSLRVGFPQREGHMTCTEHRHNLPNVSESQQKLDLLKITGVLKEESLMSIIGDDAVYLRSYGAFAALLLFILPSLRSLEMYDNSCQPLASICDAIRLAISAHQSQSHTTLFQSMEEVKYNFESSKGVQCHEIGMRFDLQPVIQLPCIRKLEFHIPDHTPFRLTVRDQRHVPLRATGITTMIIRHSSCIFPSLRGIFSQTPHLQSLTCELLYDVNKTNHTLDQSIPWIDLTQWSSDLMAVKDSLETLVLSTEYCNTKKMFYQQPRAKDLISGKLDLTSFRRLHRLECPFPFVTGDSEFLIAAEFESHLPSNLRHLSLRTDLSRTQFPYPLNPACFLQEYTYEAQRDETNCSTLAQMDLSCMFQTSLILLDRLPQLKSFSVWQPAKKALNWFDGHLKDLATTCQNRSIAAKTIVPMIFRGKDQRDWNLVKEVTLFDPSEPDRGSYEQFFRGERDGIPLGLATHYHLSEYLSGHVRK